MITIKLLRIFIQADTNKSMQCMLRQSTSEDFDLLNDQYQRILGIADKIKTNRDLTWADRYVGAKYYRSLKNELSGKTLRYDNLSKPTKS